MVPIMLSETVFDANCVQVDDIDELSDGSNIVCENEKKIYYLERPHRKNIIWYINSDRLSKN